MKIERLKNAEPQRTVTLRLSEGVMKQVDKIAEENDLSRQKLIEAVLGQVINDKNFVLRLEE